MATEVPSRGAALHRRLHKRVPHDLDHPGDHRPRRHHEPQRRPQAVARALRGRLHRVAVVLGVLRHHGIRDRAKQAAIARQMRHPHVLQQFVGVPVTLQCDQVPPRRAQRRRGQRGCPAVGVRTHVGGGGQRDAAAQELAQPRGLDGRGQRVGERRGAADEEDAGKLRGHDVAVQRQAVRLAVQALLDAAVEERVAVHKAGAENDGVHGDRCVAAAARVVPQRDAVRVDGRHLSYPDVDLAAAGAADVVPGVAAFTLQNSQC